MNIIGSKNAEKYVHWISRKLRGFPLAIITRYTQLAMAKSDTVVSTFEVKDIVGYARSRARAGTRNIADRPASARCQVVILPPLSGTKVQDI